MTISKTQDLGSKILFSKSGEHLTIKEKIKKNGFITFEIYGKAGQGAKTAANMSANCAEDVGIACWQNSGTERRGTTVTMRGVIADQYNFDRLDVQPEEMDLFVIFKEDILESDLEKYSETKESFFSKANPGAAVIINSKKTAEELVKSFPYLGHFDVFAIDAPGEIPNMQMLAATIEITEICSYERMEKEIQKKFGSKSEKILEQIKSAYPSMSYFSQKYEGSGDFNAIQIKRGFDDGSIPESQYSYPDWYSGGKETTKGMQNGKIAYIDQERCGGGACGSCIDVCPENAIGLYWPDTKAEQAPGVLKTYGGERYFILQDICKACEMCEPYCFKGAIKLEDVKC